MARVCTSMSAQTRRSPCDGSAASGASPITLGWGKLSDVGNRKGYVGYELDPVLAYSIWHVRYRPLNSHLGRWLTRDPLEYVDGASLYQYVGSNPLAGADPQGTQVDPGRRRPKPPSIPPPGGVQPGGKPKPAKCFSACAFEGVGWPCHNCCICSCRKRGAVTILKCQDWCDDRILQPPAPMPGIGPSPKGIPKMPLALAPLLIVLALRLRRRASRRSGSSIAATCCS